MADLTGLDNAPFSFDVYAVPGYDFAREPRRALQHSWVVAPHWLKQ